MIEGFFEFEHNIAAAVEYEYEQAKACYDEVVASFDATDQKHVDWFHQAGERLERARDLLLTRY